VPHRHLDRRLKLSILRAIDAIDAHRSILKASSALGITQPALTKGVLELEAQLQIRLFDRHSRGVRPTEAGLAFVQSARRILAELRRLDEELDLLSSPEGGVLSIGALPVAAAGMLPGVLKRLRTTYPRLRVRLQQGRTEDLLPLLATGEIELVVGRLYEPATPDGYDREALWSEPISILARVQHAIFDEPVTTQKLRKFDLILPTITQRSGQEIEHFLAELGVDPSNALRSSSYVLIREMLLETDMLSVMPRSMMLGDLVRGSLRVVPMPIPAAERPAGIIWRRGAQRSRSCQLFTDCLRDYLSEIASSALFGVITNGNTGRRKSDKTSAVNRSRKSLPAN
jgi:LysR family transcriptional regulator, pca operon transcriptional activator